MRKAFVTTLVDLALKDSRIVLLTGDLGFMILEPFIERFPERFFNVGVSEQNMAGVATGLAEAGFIPFIYSIAPFAALRTYEFIRNGPIKHNLPVRVVGVGAGFDYGLNGLTHWGLEDISVMRIQPGMTVIVPADSTQAGSALRATWDIAGPVYYSLGKDEDSLVPTLNGNFSMGHIDSVRDGDDFLIITMGGIVFEAIAAADILKASGVSSQIAIVSCVNPPPTDDIVKALRRHKTVLTVEVQYINGGLGSLVSEIIAEHGLNVRLVRFGVRQQIDGPIGNQKFMQTLCGLSGENIAKTALNTLKG
ncbi:transketolase family protein [Candidatus Magnetomonas plexicatena]|uniref:transketolase family protein n=1 Tax=Candidatus Magnetomonas plexicatena TaxID=2552947 RepID=UPI0011046C5F|nr:1-deoxy-D-xylulose-5-phosphate synthase [Nitrospirales bacterium LBB_01]